MKASIVWLLIFSTAAIAAPDASEWTKPRNFHVDFEQDFGAKIQITEKAKGVDPDSVSLSENKVYWFYVEPYDEKEFEQRIILSGKRMLTITLEDAYPNFPVRIEWINEKLIFVRVWWGRIAGTDMIFDIEKQEFISREMVYDGTQLYNQTQQALGKADPDGGINSVTLRSTP